MLNRAGHQGHDGLPLPEKADIASHITYSLRYKVRLPFDSTAASLSSQRVGVLEHLRVQRATPQS